MRKVRSVDEYISSFPKPTQRVLQLIRRTIRNAASQAQETINYNIPTFRLNGNLVHFAGYEHHVGFYPGSAAIAAFKREISKYKWAKGSVQFPLNKPLPLGLIRKIVQFRVAASLPDAPFRSLASPARRALEEAGITSIKLVSRSTERRIADLHGMGPNALKHLKTLLRAEGLTFKKTT